MRQSFLAIVTLFYLGGTALAADIASFSLDTLDTVGLRIAADPLIKTEGVAALKITTRTSTIVPIAEIDTPGVTDTKLTYRAQVKTDLNEQGMAYLEMWCLFKEGRYFSRGLDKPVTGSTDWTVVTTPFALEPGQSPEKIVLNLVIMGQGTVWIDDVRLSRD